MQTENSYYVLFAIHSPFPSARKFIFSGEYAVRGCGSWVVGGEEQYFCSNPHVIVDLQNSQL